MNLTAHHAFSFVIGFTGSAWATAAFLRGEYASGFMRMALTMLCYFVFISYQNFVKIEELQIPP